MTSIFLHGLESSSRGTKGRWFRERFPEMLVPDFSGPLDGRMNKLMAILDGRRDLLLIGSSFGGLMATLYAMDKPDRVKEVVLLAPALNFSGFLPDISRTVPVPASLYIGREDEVCPPDIVIPRARQVFTDLTVHLTDDDHLLRETFTKIDWPAILGS